MASENNINQGKINGQIQKSMMALQQKASVLDLRMQAGGEDAEKLKEPLEKLNAHLAKVSEYVRVSSSTCFKVKLFDPAQDHAFHICIVKGLYTSARYAYNN